MIVFDRKYPVLIGSLDANDLIAHQSVLDRIVVTIEVCKSCMLLLLVWLVTSYFYLTAHGLASLSVCEVVRL